MVQPSFFSVLQSPVTPFYIGKTITKSAKFTKNANCFELIPKTIGNRKRDCA